MSSLKGSQTEKNLLTAFAGESQARNRYTYFSRQARKDGLVQIADIFAETADHAGNHREVVWRERGRAATPDSRSFAQRIQRQLNAAG